MFTYEKIIGLIEILRRHDDAPNTHAYGGAFHAAHKEEKTKRQRKIECLHEHYYERPNSQKLQMRRRTLSRFFFAAY